MSQHGYVRQLLLLKTQTKDNFKLQVNNVSFKQMLQCLQYNGVLTAPFSGYADKPKCL